jgi:NAD(P)-dependent dehydrogenase (short-subunit alcohol dehydrogenase family)
MKKNILVFGANSFIAKSFIQEYCDRYNCIPVYREKTRESLYLDFNNSSSIQDFADRIDFQIGSILFFQGLNPSMGVREISEDHFIKMLKINLVTPVLLLRALKNKISKGSLILFFSSIAKKKGSYDPSYAAAKAGLTGVMLSLANGYPDNRFNIISLGLVEGSPVFNQMTEDFRNKHSSRMQNNSFIKKENINSVVDMLIGNENINRADIAIDGGYQ